MKILITGSGSGIGQFLSRHFLGAGHEIWGLGRTEQTDFHNECRRQGWSFRASQSDIADWKQMAALRVEVGEAWRHLDGLICCAGIQGPLGPAMTLDPLEWSASVQT